MIVDTSIPQPKPLPATGVMSSSDIVDHLDKVLASQPQPVQAAVDHAHSIMGMNPPSSNGAVSPLAQSPAPSAPETAPMSSAPTGGDSAPLTRMSSDMPDHQPLPVRASGPAMDSAAPSAPANPLISKMADQVKAGPGWHGIKNPLLKALAATGDVIGSGIFPEFAQFVPGTSAHHAQLIGEEENQIGQEQKQAKSDADIAQSSAQTSELESRGAEEDARAHSLLNPPDPKEWDRVSDLIIDPARPDIGPQVAYVRKNDPSQIQYLGKAAAKPVDHVQTDPKELYTDAIADAFKRGVDPAKDPKVQQLAAAITDIQRQPVPKEPQRDDKYISIQAKPPAERTAEENAYVKGYEKYVKETKVQPGVLRMETSANFRETPVLDTHNGNSPVYLSAAEINEANKKEPGRYLPPGVGAPALTKTALIEDIRGNVQQVRDSLNAMPELTMGDRTRIALAMRSRDPKSAISALVSSGAIPDDPHLQDYLINLTNLHENAMAMRSVLGAGQGSEDLRSAITAVVPGPQTPNKGYALKQLDTFEKTLDRLEKGIPKVKLGGEDHEESAPKPKTQAEYDALKPGTVYIDSDGIKKKKK